MESMTLINVSMWSSFWLNYKKDTYFSYNWADPPLLTYVNQ